VRPLCYFTTEELEWISTVFTFVSVAKGPKFRPQSTKRAENKLAGPRKSGAELLPDLSKKGRKGAELFSSLVFLKIICISYSKDYSYKLFYFSFLTTLDLELLKKNFKISYFQSMLCGGRTFSPAAEFFG
jgi:hypothetical protein